MSPCPTSAASFALLAVTEKPTFSYRPRSLRPKSVLVNTARPSMAQATGSIRKESVVSAWISNPTGGNQKIRNACSCSVQRRKVRSVSVRAFAQAPAVAGPRRCPQQSWEPGTPTESVGARDNRACLVAFALMARSRRNSSYFGFSESLPSHRRDARTSICGLVEQRFRARLQVPLAERTDTRRRRPSGVCPRAADSGEEFLPPHGGRCRLHRMAHATCARDHRQT